MSSKDQFTTFELNLYLSHSIMSLCHNFSHLSILGSLWHTLDLEKEGKEKKESTRGQWDQKIQPD